MNAPNQQSGSSLIEVLVAVLILSFGMLALGGMLAYAVQVPRLASYRSTAMMLASGHIERLRANNAGFTAGEYTFVLTTYPEVTPPSDAFVPCAHPACDHGTLASLDTSETRLAVFHNLPFGAIRMQCVGACLNNEGEMWVLWQEPATFASIDSTNSDECPATGTIYVGIRPRCLHIRFRL